MKLGVVLLTLLPLASALGRTQEQPRLLDRVVPLPMALNEDFRFRKTKLYLLTENVRGSHKTEFKVVGDDYFDDGRVTAWRCLLIENGTIVAETHSYMWE